MEKKKIELHVLDSLVFLFSFCFPFGLENYFIISKRWGFYTDISMFKYLQIFGYIIKHTATYLVIIIQQSLKKLFSYSTLFILYLLNAGNMGDWKIKIAYLP